MRFFIELSYNGTNFHGWQIQKKVNTIEKAVEFCLSKLLKKSINIIGAGRTDKGVHAKQMFAHFDYEKNIEHDLIKKINIFLPKHIKIIKIFPVIKNIHARFHAISRTYKYYIENVKNPFNQDFSWYCTYSLNYKKMNEASKILLHYKDFSTFRKGGKKNKIGQNNICHIYYVSLKRKYDTLCFTIKSNRFLRSMVRSIIGTLIDVGRNKITINEFIKIIELKNSHYCSSVAPACGLFLHKISYPKDIFL